MSKPRKKWEPKHQFGGNPASSWVPPHLGTNQYKPAIKPKRKKK